MFCHHTLSFVFIWSVCHLGTHALVFMSRSNRLPAHRSASDTACRTSSSPSSSSTWKRKDFKAAILVFLFLLHFIKDFYNHRYVCCTQSTFHCSPMDFSCAPPEYSLFLFSLLMSTIISFKPYHTIIPTELSL